MDMRATVETWIREWWAREKQRDFDAIMRGGKLAASALAGLVPTASLGGGTANSGTFLRGDQTWATPAGGSGGYTKVLLNYIAAADMISSITSNTWTDLVSNQSFTVDDATATILVAVGGGAYGVNSGAAGEIASRINVDSGGTPITRMLGGDFSAANGSTAQFANFLAGAGVISLGSLSAATHTVKVQIYAEQTGTVRCRPSSFPNMESLAILVLEVK